MRKLLASTFVLALLAVAIAAPPIDYDLTCGDELIGVLSLTEGKVHVALVEGASCAGGAILVEGPEVPAVSVEVDDWDAEPLVIHVTIGVDDDAVEADDVDLVMVPEVAIDGMLDAQRLRAAAMEMRREAAERGETDRDRIAWDDEGAPGDGEPGGPPADAPCDDAIGDGPGGPPDDAPRGDGTDEGSGRRP
ncbi:MAG: hypothetical protein R6T93_10360 [Trueperaceae bacterium]